MCINKLATTCCRRIVSILGPKPGREEIRKWGNEDAAPIARDAVQIICRSCPCVCRSWPGECPKREHQYYHNSGQSTSLGRQNNKAAAKSHASAEEFSLCNTSKACVRDLLITSQWEMVPWRCSSETGDGCLPTLETRWAGKLISGHRSVRKTILFMSFLARNQHASKYIHN